MRKKKVASHFSVHQQPAWTYGTLPCLAAEIKRISEIVCFVNPATSTEPKRSPFIYHNSFSEDNNELKRVQLLGNTDR